MFVKPETGKAYAAAISDEHTLDVDAYNPSRCGLFVAALTDPRRQRLTAGTAHQVRDQGGPRDVAPRRGRRLWSRHQHDDDDHALVGLPPRRPVVGHRPLGRNGGSLGRRRGKLLWVRALAGQLYRARQTPAQLAVPVSCRERRGRVRVCRRRCRREQDPQLKRPDGQELPRASLPLRSSPNAN